MVFVFLLQVLHETFPKHTFLMNGLIQGVKVSNAVTLQVQLKVRGGRNLETPPS